MSNVLVRPLRGHQSRALGRWVAYREDPYMCPADEADRLIRHNIVERVVPEPAPVSPDPMTLGPS